MSHYSLNPLLASDPLFNPQAPVRDLVVQDEVSSLAPLKVMAYDQEIRHILIATLYPDGIVETHQDYTPKRAARALFRALEMNVPTERNLYDAAVQSGVSFFVHPTKGPLVTLFQNGTIKYREGFKPDPIAQALWECLSKVMCGG